MKHFEISRKVIFVLVIAMLGLTPIFAQVELRLPEYSFAPFFAVVTEEESSIPQSIRNNEFYLESMRLTKLAQDTYDYGDYEASSGFAEEAIRYARLSDEFVAVQLIDEAKRLVDWADFYNIAALHPNNVQLGKDHYERAVAFHSQEVWNESIDSAIKSIEVLSVLQAGTGTATQRRPSSSTQGLVRQYTVRTWAVERDCLWTIAGYDWVYGDPWKWRNLYEANKDKLPEADNPHLVVPGLILDIPSIEGETRQGMYRP